MPVLVTGGAGHVGAHAALALVECGERVIVLDDLSTGPRESVPLRRPGHPATLVADAKHREVHLPPATSRPRAAALVR